MTVLHYLDLLREMRRWGDGNGNDYTACSRAQALASVCNRPHSFHGVLDRMSLFRQFHVLQDCHETVLLKPCQRACCECLALLQESFKSVVDFICMNFDSVIASMSFSGNRISHSLSH